VRKCGLDRHITFTGLVPYNEVMRHFRESDMFCLTSRYEGTCMVLHEAAVARLPIVATSVAGAQDIIEHGENSYLAPIGDWRAVAQHLTTLLADPAKRDLFAERIHDYVTRHMTKENALAHFRAMLEHVMNTAS